MRGGFPPWVAEVENGTWGSWEELKKHYPNASQTAGSETHFPLTADGTGVRAMILFKQPLMILLCIAPSPITFRPPHRRRISLPQSK
jgi:hypothetical protein